MASVAKQIASALLDELDAHTFSRAVRVVRKYVPQMDLRDMDGVLVTVVPRGNEIANADRSRVSNQVSIDVAVQAKVRSTNAEDVDPLMDVVQEVADFLTRRRLDAVPGASWLRIANVPIYAADHLAGKSMFTSVLTVTYLVLK